MPAPGDAASAAIESLLVRYGRMVTAVARRHGLGDDEADEVVQEVRIRLWRARDSAETIDTAPTSYVYRTAVTAALDVIRRHRARARREDPGGDIASRPAATSRPDEALERRELAAQVLAALESLAPPRRVVVRMHLAGFDREESCRLLGWTEAKVRNLLHRGLLDLRRVLRERGIDPERAR